MFLPDEVHQEPPAIRVELAHDIVEQEDRILAGLRPEEFEFGKLQREHAGALLSLRAERAQVDLVDRELQVVAVRAAARHAAQDIELALFR